MGTIGLYVGATYKFSCLDVEQTREAFRQATAGRETDPLTMRMTLANGGHYDLRVEQPQLTGEGATELTTGTKHGFCAQYTYQGERLTVRGWIQWLPEGITGILRIRDP